MIKRVRLIKVEMWVPALYIAIAGIIIGGLVFFKLGTLTPGLSQNEVATYQSASSIRLIRDNPINAPFKLIRLGTVKLTKQTSAFNLRLASSVFGLLIAGTFYYVAKHWLTKRMAVLGTLMLVSSSWFLHTARSATDSASQWFLLLIAAWGIWLMKTRRFELLLIAGVLVLGTGLYIPAMVWFMAFGAIWQRGRLKKLLDEISWIWRLGTLVLALVLISPLILGLVAEPSLILDWLGLPTQIPSLAALGRGLVRIPLNLIAIGPNNPGLWLGTLPILDIFASAMALFGSYSYYFALKLDRVKLLLMALVSGSILIALGGPINITLLIPFVYILVASGITLMAQQWFTVFPRNPLARGLGLVLLTLAVLLSVYYQTNNYFVAWARNSETKAIYNKNLDTMIRE